MRVDFTTTATCRPEVLVKTLSSFRDNLTGLELREQRLFLNVDPVPDSGCAREVVRVANTFFGRVVVNYPSTPNFARAVAWCLQQPGTRYFFHLEDDWEMLRQYDISDLAERMEAAGEDLACVNLRAYDCDEADPRISLCPGLWRAEAGRVLGRRLEAHANHGR
jgi:hypothetical protein